MHTKRPGLSNSVRERVQLAPERARDLEVVALVAHHVEEGLVAAELEIFARRVGAERLVRLAVRVAPEVHERACPSPRRAAGSSGTAPRPLRRARGRRSRRASPRASLPPPRRSCPARSATCPAARRSSRLRPQAAACDPPGSTGLPHLSSALIDKPERLACAHQCRQHRAPAHAGPRHEWRSWGSRAAPRSRRWRSGRRTRGTRTALSQ